MFNDKVQNHSLFCHIIRYSWQFDSLALFTQVKLVTGRNRTFTLVQLPHLDVLKKNAAIKSKETDVSTIEVQDALKENQYSCLFMFLTIHLLNAKHTEILFCMQQCYTCIMTCLGWCYLFSTMLKGSWCLFAPLAPLPPVHT